MFYIYRNQCSVLAEIGQQPTAYTQEFVVRPPSAEQQQARQAICNMLFCLNDFCQTNYLKIHRTDLRQFFRVGRTMAVDD